MPFTYIKDLILQLQKLRQGSRSVEEMYKEMKMLSIKSGLKESEEAKHIFLNQDIQDVVELQKH